MPSFTDSAGREWKLNVLPPDIARIREDCDPEFLKGDNHLQQTAARLAADPYSLCRVLYLLTEDERKERGLSEKDFYLGVLGGAIEEAERALQKAMLVFTPSWMRQALEASAAKVERLQREGAERLMAKLTDDAIERKFNETMEAATATLLPTPTTTPDSSESTPAG